MYFYLSKPAVTQDLEVLSRRTIPFGRLLQQAKGTSDPFFLPCTRQDNGNRGKKRLLISQLID